SDLSGLGPQAGDQGSADVSGGSSDQDRGRIHGRFLSQWIEWLESTRSGRVSLRRHGWYFGARDDGIAEPAGSRSGQADQAGARGEGGCNQECPVVAADHSGDLLPRSGQRPSAGGGDGGQN